MAHNLCRDYWRSASYRTDSIATRELPDRADTDAEVVELYERQETKRELISALDHLPEVQREVVMLRFFQDMKLQEISQVLEVPLGTVKGHLYQALKKLHKKIGAGAPDGKEAVWHA
ncbi:RNA polymerase sigma factor SigV [compost metagenome]